MIDNLKAFAAVIDCKSLTKAASRLFLTQSAISRRIQQLEEALGGTLLDQTQRPPSSTALGQRVYEQSLPILRAVDDLMTLTRQDAAPTGTLRFGMSQAIGDVIMADAVEQLSGEFPTLDVRVRAGWGAGLAAQVSAGELDAAIVMLPAGTQPAAPLIGRTIATVDMAIVQSRRRPRVRKAVALADLAKRSRERAATRRRRIVCCSATRGFRTKLRARIPPTRQTCEKPLSLASPVSSMKSRRRWGGRRDCL
jgi:DNA-binding transcriptional LysR family regulator